MISASARCACMTKAGRKAGASAGMCSARITSTTCAILGGASPNTPAISTTSRRRSVGRQATTSRRILFISGVRTCRGNSQSTMKAARPELDPNVFRDGRNAFRPFRFQRASYSTITLTFSPGFNRSCCPRPLSVRNFSRAWSDIAIRCANFSTVSFGPTVTIFRRSGLTC